MLVQLVAVVGGMVLVRALFARAGVRLDAPQAAAVALLAFLAVFGVSTLRETWKVLDEQRALYAAQTPETARRACTGVGVEVPVLQFVRDQIPPGERYHLEAPGLVGTGDRCLRMVLLPRLEVKDAADARFLVLWGQVRPELVEAAKRRGATVAIHDDTHQVVRLP